MDDENEVMWKPEGEAGTDLLAVPGPSGITSRVNNVECIEDDDSDMDAKDDTVEFGENRLPCVTEDTNKPFGGYRICQEDSDPEDEQFDDDLPTRRFGLFGQLKPRTADRNALLSQYEKENLNHEEEIEKMIARFAIIKEICDKRDNKEKPPVGMPGLKKCECEPQPDDKMESSTDVDELKNKEEQINTIESVLSKYKVEPKSMTVEQVLEGSDDWETKMWEDITGKEKNGLRDDPCSSTTANEGSEGKCQFGNLFLGSPPGSFMNEEKRKARRRLSRRRNEYLSTLRDSGELSGNSVVTAMGDMSDEEMSILEEKLEYVDIDSISSIVIDCKPAEVPLYENARRRSTTADDQDWTSPTYNWDFDTLLKEEMSERYYESLFREWKYDDFVARQCGVFRLKF